MLVPKRVKFRRVHRGKMRGESKGGKTVACCRWICWLNKLKLCPLTFMPDTIQSASVIGTARIKMSLSIRLSGILPVILSFKPILTGFNRQSQIWSASMIFQRLWHRAHKLTIMCGRSMPPKLGRFMMNEKFSLNFVAVGSCITRFESWSQS